MAIQKAPSSSTPPKTPENAEAENRNSEEVGKIEANTAKVIQETRGEISKHVPEINKASSSNDEKLMEAKLEIAIKKQALKAFKALSENNRKEILSTGREPTKQKKQAIIDSLRSKEVHISEVNFEPLYNKIYDLIEGKDIASMPERSAEQISAKEGANAALLLRQINQGTNFNDEEKAQIKEGLFYLFQTELNGRPNKQKNYPKNVSRALSLIHGRFTGRNTLKMSFLHEIESEYTKDATEALDEIYKKLDVPQTDKDAFTTALLSKIHSDVYNTTPKLQPLLDRKFYPKINQAIREMNQKHIPKVFFIKPLQMQINANSIEEYISGDFEPHGFMNQESANEGFMKEIGNYSPPNWLTNTEEEKTPDSKKPQPQSKTRGSGSTSITRSK